MRDLIDRESAIWHVKANAHSLISQIKVLEELPSAQPKQKVGKWIGGDIGYCTCCGHKGCASDIWNACEEMYCPNCGAKMEEQDG